MYTIIKQSLNIITSAIVIYSMLTGTLLAEPIYHPSGPKLTFGGITHRHMNVSDMGNPAYPASLPYPEGESGLYGGGLSIGLGIEYDGNDNFFDLLNKVAKSGSTVPGGDDGSGDSGQDSGIIIPPALILPDGDLDPEVKAKLEELVDEVAASAVLVGLAVTGVNAKAFISADVPVLISNETLGGSWTFGVNASVITNLAGINDPIEFDVDAAKVNLAAAYQAANVTPPAEPVTYDLTGGASVTISPDGTANFRFDNNSGVVTKAVQITEISIGYSRKVWQRENNKIYLGVKPKYFDVGLSNTAIPISDIENAKDIFEALDDADFKYEQDFGLDIGAVWSGKQYQLGVTLTNLNEPDFQFPAQDLSGFTNPVIIQAIRDREKYVMEQQLKFDAGYISGNGAWGINFGYEANAVPDPMGDDYQWLSFGAGFASDNWWLPGARLGIRKNLSGLELTYVTAGVTVFNIVNLDLAMTTETIDIDGDTVPQGLIGNIGVQFLF